MDLPGDSQQDQPAHSPLIVTPEPTAQFAGFTSPVTRPTARSVVHQCFCHRPGAQPEAAGP
jgi:hypothetical protein